MAGPVPDPVVKKWPHWPYLVTCGGVRFNPVKAFSGPTGVERGARPSEVALGKVLRQRWAHGLVPRHNWRLLVETSRFAEFASGRLASRHGPGTISFERQKGEWQLNGLSSGCRPMSVVRGETTVTWGIAKKQSHLGKNTRRIWINLGPGGCASGMSQNARAREPVVRRLGRKLIMAITLKPLPPGLYTCEGFSEPPLRVRLPGRLGNRQLFDGGTYPPGDVIKRWRKRSQTNHARHR